MSGTGPVQAGSGGRSVEVVVVTTTDGVVVVVGTIDVVVVVDKVL